MNNLGEDLQKFSDLSAVIGEGQIIVCMLMSFLLAMVVAKVYQYSFRGVSYSPAFMQTLVICAMVIAAVMLIIGSNIARAFSLVGALSIIRFRNAVKDPRDVAFIFLAMGVGMACGSGFYMIAVTLTAVSSLVIVLMTVFDFGAQSTVERMLRIQAPASKNFEHLFDDVLKSHTKGFSLMSIETTRMGTEIEMLFGIRIDKAFSTEKLIDALSSLNDNLKIQVLGSNHTVDL
jgi:uncharacterized membrane protein YhiD involved in acid resistance